MQPGHYSHLINIFIYKNVHCINIFIYKFDFTINIFVYYIIKDFILKVKSKCYVVLD